jgi:hypothetical protein
VITLIVARALAVSIPASTIKNGYSHRVIPPPSMRSRPSRFEVKSRAFGPPWSRSTKAINDDLAVVFLYEIGKFIF